MLYIITVLIINKLIIESKINRQNIDLSYIHIYHIYTYVYINIRNNIIQNYKIIDSICD